MAWRTVQKDGAIEIYGSLFYYRGEPPYTVGPGTRLWVVDGDQMDRIHVWVDQKRHEFRGIWGCQTVWDEANLFHRPEPTYVTRSRQKKTGETT
jgi:hypothetical protein